MSIGTTTPSDLRDDVARDEDSQDEATIYSAIGGWPALVAAVDGVYGRILADPELSPLFPRGVGERHRRFVATFLGEALGGPRRYHGPDIATTHHGLGITDAHFQRVAAYLDATLDELGVPRHLTDRIVAIVAGLRPAVVTA
jgi:hemoglobin